MLKKEEIIILINCLNNIPLKNLETAKALILIQDKLTEMIKEFDKVKEVVDSTSENK